MLDIIAEKQTRNGLKYTTRVIFKLHKTNIKIEPRFHLPIVFQYWGSLESSQYLPTIGCSGQYDGSPSTG